MKKFILIMFIAFMLGNGVADAAPPAPTYPTEKVVMTRKYAKKRRPGSGNFHKRGYWVRY